MRILQFVLTPAAGKRLIGKAMAVHPAVKQALLTGTLVIVAGTTNGYVAEKILADLGQAEGFSRGRFFRGLVLLPDWTTEEGRLLDDSGFPGDVVIVKGVWQKGLTIFDVAAGLKAGDVILKGANALDPLGRAAVLIGHPQGGTALAALPAAIGRRVRLILPVGLEKRISGDIMEISSRLNGPDCHGPRLLPLPGEAFTEIDAIRLLCGAEAQAVAAGGVGGAVGAVRLAVWGNEGQLEKAEGIIGAVAGEKPFKVK